MFFFLSLFVCGACRSEQGFIGRLQLATPDVYACSSLDPILEATGAPTSSEPGLPLVGKKTTDEARSMIGRHRQSLKGARGGEQDGRLASPELPRTAVLVSRSIRHDGAACTFEKKVSTFVKEYDLPIRAAS